jgi:hypothetical protein
VLAKNLQSRPVNGKQRPAILTNKKQDNFDQKHADKVEWSVFCINLKNFDGGVTHKIKKLL